jgi:hypothetical protein
MPTTGAKHRWEPTPLAGGMKGRRKARTPHAPSLYRRGENAYKLLLCPNFWGSMTISLIANDDRSTRHFGTKVHTKG